MPMHEHYEELCALAAIGQLSPEEHQELVAHLQACDLCKRAGDDFAVILDQLPSATPPDDSGDTEELLSESYRQKFLLKAAAAGVRFTPEVTAIRIATRAPGALLVVSAALATGSSTAPGLADPQPEASAPAAATAASTGRARSRARSCMRR